MAALPDSPSSSRPVMLFDGVCNLCSAVVQFVLKRDPKKKFRFASLQSELGKKTLHAAGRSEADLDTLLLLEGDRIYAKSGAALRIARRLSGAWPLLSVFWILPRFLRDGLYDYVAKNRYRWFGKKQECWIPSTEWQDRFI